MISLSIQFLFLIWTTALSEDVIYVNYTLDDFTLKNKKIGNIIHSSKIQNILFNHAFLNNYQDLFEIKNSGDLYTKVDIERDEICIKLTCCQRLICNATLKSYLFKGNNLTKFYINISINDSNDNKPLFINAQKVIIIPESAELNSTFKLPKATDLDSLTYGVDSYTLIDSTATFVVTMERNEPILKLVKSLDREVLSTYNIRLMVYDKGSPQLSNSLNLIITISDVNDNTPYFVKSQNDNTPLKIISGSHAIKIKENNHGDVIYHLHAHDNDEADNAKIYYSISQTQSQPIDVVKQKFSLKSPYETAKIQLRQNLDYENEWERHITLVIVATDNGKPPRSASISLILELSDENDNKPIINETMSKDIKENDSMKYQLKIFSVSDRDSVSQKMVICSLSDDLKDKFELRMYDWNLYDLHNKVAFDFEERKFELVKIICIDRGVPELTRTSNFYVKIIDQNDNSPFWEKEVFEITLKENDISRRELIMIIATDADSGYYGALSYNISPANDISHLKFVRIDPVTAVIYVNQPVDREIYPELSYDITATDGRGASDLTYNQPKLSNKTKLIIKILDENDNSPKFIGNKKYFKITENCRKNSVVDTLQFYDADEPPNNILTMYLLEYNHSTHSYHNSKWFDIKYNGTITVKTILNREELFNVSLMVRVEDHGRPRRTVTEEIMIEILDENDNAPLLQFPSNNSYIPINGIVRTALMDTKLTQLESTDPDNGKNATIFYKIINSNFPYQNMLKIARNTGEITTNWQSSDLPDIGVYVLRIAIEDGGLPPQSTIVTFYVNVTNESVLISSEAYMSNIVILILIIVCSLALIVSLIAAIFWVRFRVTGESTALYQEEILEREHLNKDQSTNNYSLMTLKANLRQNSFDNINLNAYDSYNPRQQNHILYGQTNMLPKDTFNMLENSRLTPCEDCFNSFGTVPSHMGRYESPNIGRYKSPIPADMNSLYNNHSVNLNSKIVMLQPHLGNDFNSISNAHPPNMIGDPNFSDSGKGGSVEDLNYRLPVALSTFTTAPYNQTMTSNVKSCQSQYGDQNNKRYPQNKNNETIF